VQVNHAVYRARMDEAAREIDDPELLREINTELGAVLLSEQPTDAGMPHAVLPAHPSRSGVWLTAILVPLLAVLIYMQVSEPFLGELEGAEIVLTTAPEDRTQLESWRQRLSARVKDVSTDDKSWYLLGHAHLKLGNFGDARRAFATAHDLTGDDLNIILYWLQARYLDSRGMLDDVSRSLADKLLIKHPNFPVVLEMLALDAYRREYYGDAVTYLHRAMSSTRDAGQQAVFATAISQVRGQMAQPGPGFGVKVSTRWKVPRGAEVFVIARPVGGGVPYAVVKRAAIAMPFEVRLDDLVSMSETRLLSSAQTLEVLVRLSLSGAARADEGDWQWRSSPLSVGDSGLPVLEAELAPPLDAAAQ